MTTSTPRRRLREPPANLLLGYLRRWGEMLGWLGKPVSSDVEGEVYTYLLGFATAKLAARGVPADEQADLAQDCLVKIRKGWGAYTGAGSPGAWASRIILNEVRDWARRTGRDPLAYAAGADDEGLLEALHERDDLLAELLAELLPVERRVVWRHLEGKTYKEIADMEREEEKHADSEDEAFARSERTAERVHKRALDKLRVSGKSTAPLLALLFGVRLGDLPETPPDVEQRVLRNVLGCDRPEAVRADRRRPGRSDPPSAWPPAAWLPGVLAGSFAGVVAAVLCFFLLGATVPRCDRETHDGRGVEPVAATAVGPGLSLLAPAPPPASEPVEAAPMPAAVAAPVLVASRRHGPFANPDDRLFFAALAAMGELRPRVALDSLFAAALRYPNSPHKDLRNGLIADLCRTTPDLRCRRTP